MTPSRLAARAILAATLLGGAGCSLALKTDAEQCTVDADCAARGAAFAGTVCMANVCQAKAAPDPKWGCIGSVPALPTGGMKTVKLQMLDLISTMPVTTGLDIKLCSKLDPPCTSNLGTPAPDAMGFVSVTVKSDFDGFLDVTDTTGTYIPALVFIDMVAAGDNTDILLIPKGAEAGLATNAMVTIDPMGALLLVRTVDCTGKRTAGVSVGLSPKGKETGFYVINNTPQPSATETDSSGNSGFINIAAPSSPVITGTVSSTGKEMGKITTLVRSGSMTYQLLRPSTNL